MSSESTERDAQAGGLSRRELLRRGSTGFGWTALAAMLSGGAATTSIAAPAPRRHARNVIFCFMSGGVSHVDTFDPKPRLDREHGQKIKMKMVLTLLLSATI